MCFVDGERSRHQLVDVILDDIIDSGAILSMMIYTPHDFWPRSMQPCMGRALSLVSFPCGPSGKTPGQGWENSLAGQTLTRGGKSLVKFPSSSRF